MTDLTREQERQLEVWGLMQPYCMPSFEDLVYPIVLAERIKAAARRRAGLGLKPAPYRPKSNLKERDVVQIREMAAGGATLDAIARAFTISPSTASRIAIGRSYRSLDGVIREPKFVKVTAEVVSAVLAQVGAGSQDQIARAVGVSKRTVANIFSKNGVSRPRARREEQWRKCDQGGAR